jgi:hypothetical protein
VCGAVSGNLEAIDFDCAGAAYDPWRAIVREVDPDLLTKLVVERSPSGGYHVFYRCEEPVPGNVKLAQRTVHVDGSDEVLLYGKKFKPRRDAQGRWHVVVTLVETRGEGGIIVCAPSLGYHVEQGTIDAIPTITREQREQLIVAALSLNEVWPESPEATRVARRDGDRRPGDDFSRRGDIRPVLIRHGWTFVRQGGNGNELWRRPGKTDGWSASLRDGVLYCFSSNAAPFEPGRAYSSFAVLALLDHGGDFAAAARQLADEGYGTQSGTDAAGTQSTDWQAADQPDVDLPTDVPIAEQLVRLAMRHYRFGRTDRDEPFAVEIGGPNVALPLRGHSDALRARLAKLYHDRAGRPCGSSTLGDALSVLVGTALNAEPEPVHLRLASHDDGVVIDLGDPRGRAVIVRPGGWEVVERSPVSFRRSALTGTLPIPERGGTLNELRELLNVSDESWPQIVGWLVAALVPDIPHPILLLSGLQGAGKSCAARLLTTLVDPSPAPLRSEPKDLEQFSVMTGGSWVTCFDNLCSIPAWLSDCLCRVTSGDGLAKRKLYTDSEVSVLAHRRVVLLTSIDPGAIRGDLADRLLLIELENIDDSARRPEREIDATFEARRPRLFGALLDVLAAALSQLPHVRLERLPRMADFARVLAACDAAGVTRGALDRYLGQRGRVMEEVVETDPFATAIIELVRKRGTWRGTATQLLRAVDPIDPAWRPPDCWPKPNTVSGKLKRLTPALQAKGVTVTFERVGHDRRRVIRLACAVDVDPSTDDASPADSAGWEFWASAARG